MPSGRNGVKPHPSACSLEEICNMRYLEPNWMIRNMTRLIVPLTSTTAEQARADLKQALEAGAELIELRLDYLADLTADDIAALRRMAGDEIPLLLTARCREEGGVWDADETHRMSRLIDLAPHGDLCDIELATWERSANVRQKIELALQRLRGGNRDGASARLVLSSHDFQQRPANLCRIVETMNGVGECGVAKIVFAARHISETFELFDLMHSNPKPILAIAMGEAGVITRILAKKFGAFGTFASLGQGRESAPGQVSIEQMKNVYRWDAINRDTAVYGVIGHPVGHSMSPAIHNAAFDRCGINAVYVPLLIEPSYDHFVDFLRHALDRDWFDLRGCSVTIPHKANAIKLVHALSGYIEPLAARIGAVNTLTFGDGKIAAHNTDYAGSLDALTGAMGCTRADLKGLSAAVLGAGGAARALVAGLCDCGCRVTIYNRTPERAKELADDFRCTAAPIDERVRAGTQIVVNATSIGMHPKSDDTPLPADRMHPDMVVFDTVYNPIETRLLREAKQVGCRTADGVAMFVNQAAAQFERWTGKTAPRERMREVVVARLQK